MAVAELETHRVVTDPTQACHSDAGETPRSVAAPTLAEDVYFAHVLGARGKLPQQLGPEALFMTVLPSEGDEVSDDL
jgi:hypothetical protein